MATLHVRDVPDPLYGLLRERATANDRSIGAETIQLLQERLGAPRLTRGQGAPDPMPNRPLFVTPRRRSSKTGLFERFTTEARQVVDEAHQQASSWGHGQVGTEHLLLAALCGDASAPASRVLHRGDVTREHVESELQRSRGRGERHADGKLSLTSDAKRALELALHEALTLNDDTITPEHILLGIIGQADSAGAMIVRARQPDLAKLRASLKRTRPRAGSSQPASAPFFVFELEGDAASWETQLNDAARRGYELIAIVDGRAILKLT